MKKGYLNSNHIVFKSHNEEEYNKIIKKQYAISYLYCNVLRNALKDEINKFKQNKRELQQLKCKNYNTLTLKEKQQCTRLLNYYNSFFNLIPCEINKSYFNQSNKDLKDVINIINAPLKGDVVKINDINLLFIKMINIADAGNNINIERYLTMQNLHKHGIKGIETIFNGLLHEE